MGSVCYSLYVILMAIELFIFEDSLYVILMDSELFMFLLQISLFYFHFCEQMKQDSRKTDGSVKASEDELTCSICLEQVNRGELVRSLPCLHQVHPVLTIISHLCN